MAPEDVFIDTLEDLRKRCDLRATAYDMLQASGLMRRLLIDQLWVQANREIKHKPISHLRRSFVCATSEEEHGVSAWVPGLHADPALDAVHLSRFLNRPLLLPNPLTAEQFLREEIVTTRLDNHQEAISVRVLIKHFANTRGGVHFNPEGKSVSDALDRLPLRAESPLLYTLVALGRVTVKALEPIASAILLSRLPGLVGGLRYEETADE